MSQGKSKEAGYSHQDRCPLCGAALDHPADNPAEGSKERSIVIIERPDQWTPASELDAPTRGRVVDVVDIEVTDAATFVRQHNGASLDKGVTCWAAVTAGEAKIGEEVELLQL